MSPDDYVTVQVTVTGTYRVQRADFPDNYNLPWDAPVADIIQVDRDECEGDAIHALLLLNDEEMKVELAEVPDLDSEKENA